MKNISIYVAEKENGFFTVKVMGQPNDHVSDWRGCNYRAVVVPGLGRKDLTKEIAFALYRSIDVTKLAEILEPMTGSALSDRKFAEEFVIQHD